MPKQTIIYWLETNIEEVKQILVFITIMLMGTFLKIVNLLRSGAKANLYWFFTEVIMSVFVGLSVYAVFDQFLNCNFLLTCVVCAWCAQFSTVFHEKVKMLLEHIFDGLKQWLTKKLS